MAGKDTSLANVVAVVTGASRGIGRGMARALGQKGATVYVTGRTATQDQSEWHGTVAATAEEVTQAGGKGIGVLCDSADAEQIKALMDRIDRDHGKLHILVNNAAFLNGEITAPGAFWEKSLDLMRLFDVGIRSTYLASYHAAPLLLKSGRGLICNTSAYRASALMCGPAYGAHKAALDKFAEDMAHDFRGKGVSAFSFWVGPTATERYRQRRNIGLDAPVDPSLETPEFSGHVLAALYGTPDLFDRSGETYIVAELAAELGVTDADGRQPASYREKMGGPVPLVAMDAH